MEAAWQSPMEEAGGGAPLTLPASLFALSLVRSGPHDLGAAALERLYHFFYSTFEIATVRGHMTIHYKAMP